MSHSDMSAVPPAACRLPPACAPSAELSHSGVCPALPVDCTRLEGGLGGPRKASRVGVID